MLNSWILNEGSKCHGNLNASQTWPHHYIHINMDVNALHKQKYKLLLGSFPAKQSLDFILLYDLAMRKALQTHHMQSVQQPAIIYSIHTSPMSLKVIAQHQKAFITSKETSAKAHHNSCPLSYVRDFDMVTFPNRKVSSRCHQHSTSAGSRKTPG